MKIFILRKSLADLKNPVVRNAYETDAQTVQEFICEMAEKNYRKKPTRDSLEESKAWALSEFSDGSYYIVNRTRDCKYERPDEETAFCEGDEIVLIKLKYLRGIIW